MYCMFFLLPLPKSVILNSGCCLYSPFRTEALIPPPPHERRVSCWQFPAKTLPGIQSSWAQGSCLIKGHTASWGDLFLKSHFSEGQCERQSFHWNGGAHCCNYSAFYPPPPNPTSLIPSWLFPEAFSNEAFVDKSVSWGTWPVILWREKK